MRTFSLFIAATLLVFLGASCATKAPEQPKTEYRPVATIKDIMDSHVEPAADFIFESVGTTISAAGTVEKQPRNADEWKEVRRKAVILMEAANLLVMPGRHVAKPGEKSENPGIELGPEQIEALINEDRESFIKFAYVLQDTAIETMKMADNKDVEGLLNVGDSIDRACETCHLKYWYPNEAKPPAEAAAPAETKK